MMTEGVEVLKRIMSSDRSDEFSYGKWPSVELDETGVCFSSGFSDQKFCWAQSPKMNSIPDIRV